MGLDEQIYPAYKVAVLCALLREQDIAVHDVLADSNIEPNQIESADLRISKRQLIAVYENAVRLTQRPGLGLAAGERLHVTEYGMYGFAMLSSANLREALDFSIRYHALATPTVRMSLTLDDDAEIAAFGMEDSLGIDALTEFNLEF